MLLTNSQNSPQVLICTTETIYVARIVLEAIFASINNERKCGSYSLIKIYFSPILQSIHDNIINNSFLTIIDSSKKNF